MKLNRSSRATVDAEAERWNRQVAAQVNAVSEGQIAGFYTASTAPPTTGTWARGDEARNTTPSELGAVSSKYVIRGWICTVAGTPGTWVQQRFLTGN
jgi:hypothetical protein